MRGRACVSVAGLVERSCGAFFRASGRGHVLELGGCDRSWVYLTCGHDLIPLFQMVKPNSNESQGSEVEGSDPWCSSSPEDIL